MLHYTYARQLDSGIHQQLISENIVKLKRTQQVTMQRQKSLVGGRQQLCPDKKSNADSNQTPPPNTTFDQMRRTTLSEAGTADSAFHLLNVRTSPQIFLSLL